MMLLTLSIAAVNFVGSNLLPGLAEDFTKSALDGNFKTSEIVQNAAFNLIWGGTAGKLFKPITDVSREFCKFSVLLLHWHYLNVVSMQWAL